MWFLFGEVSSSSGCLGWTTLFYCGTPRAFHKIILGVDLKMLDFSLKFFWPVTYVAFQKMIVFFAIFFNTVSYFIIYQKICPFIFYLLAFQTTMHLPPLVSIYSARQYLSDQTPFMKNTIFLRITFLFVRV